MEKYIYYIKLSVLSILLFVEGLLLTNQIISFVQSKSYFLIETNFIVITLILMTTILYTFSLTIGAWKIWWHNAFPIISISLAILISFLKINNTYAYLVTSATVILLSYDFYRSYKLNKILIKFDPKIILKFSARGLLTIISVLAGVIVLLDASGVSKINIGKEIVGVAKEPIKQVVKNQLETQIQSQSVSLGGYQINEEDPEVQKILNQFGIDTLTPSKILDNSKLEVDINKAMENQINTLVEPYKNFVNPLMAVLVFGIFQLYATVAYFIYMISVDVIFLVAKKTGFLKIEKEMVEKETLSF